MHPTIYTTFFVYGEYNAPVNGMPTIPLPRETKGYQGVFTGEAGPRVGHLTFPCTLTLTICKLEDVAHETMIAMLQQNQHEGNQIPYVPLGYTRY